jgi:hypothetical protein
MQGDQALGVEEAFSCLHPVSRASNIRVVHTLASTHSHQARVSPRCGSSGSFRATAPASYAGLFPSRFHSVAEIFPRARISIFTTALASTLMPKSRIRPWSCFAVSSSN